MAELMVHDTRCLLIAVGRRSILRLCRIFADSALFPIFLIALSRAAFSHFLACHHKAKHCINYASFFSLYVFCC